MLESCMESLREIEHAKTNDNWECLKFSERACLMQNGELNRILRLRSACFTWIQGLNGKGYALRSERQVRSAKIPTALI